MTNSTAKGFGDKTSALVKKARETQKMPLEVELMWAKGLTNAQNQLKLDGDLLYKSYDPEVGGVLPPHLGNKEWIKFIGKDAEYLGRYHIPNTSLTYDAKVVQPRKKELDHDHRLDLKISFNAQGYKLDAPCPVATITTDLNSTQLKGLSGFHRFSVMTDQEKGQNAVYQDSYFYDVYKFKTPLAEVIARNITNHHNNPAKSLTKQDLIKEVTNAIEHQLIERNVQAIEQFVNTIASDKPAYWRKDIAKKGFEKAEVVPSFRSYSTKGDNQYTLKYAVENEFNLVPMGVENRTDQELLDQGYILFCGHRGDAVGAWAKGIYRAAQLGIPVWILGYAANLTEDLPAFRENWVEQFLDYKEFLIRFSYTLFNDDMDTLDILNKYEELINEKFQIKFGGFLPQHSKADPKSGGAPTEVGIVNEKGESVEFDPEGDCLTL